TCLIFLDGLELPHFAAVHLMKDAAGRAALRAHYARYAAIARTQRLGFVLESPTWRARADWGAKLGYPPAELAAMTREAIALMHELRAEYAGPETPIVISGCIGPRGDGYDPGQVMSPAKAEAYHAMQVDCFHAARADMVTAITMTNANEA